MTTRRAWTEGRGGWFLTALLLTTLLGMVAWLVQRHDVEIDVSYGQRRTLAPQTLSVLELLDRPVLLRGFYRDVPHERQMLFDLVERYRKHTDRLALEFIDIDRRPELAHLHNVSLPGTVVLSSGELEVRVVAPGEAELTGAIVQLLTERPPKVTFLTGHGQASIEDAGAGGISRAAELLARQNFRVDSFSLAGAARIPADADVVVMAAPEQPMALGEAAALVEHLRRGGALMAMVEPLGASDFDSLLTQFGIVADPGFAVDPSDARRNIAGPGTFRIPLAQTGNPEHPITRDFAYPTLYPLARSLSSVQPPPPGVEVHRLVETGADSWEEMDLTQLAEGRPEFDETIDRGGPLALAYAAKISLRRFLFEGREADVGLTSTLLDLHSDVVDMRDSTAVDTLRVGEQEFPQALPEQARLVVTGDVDFINNANLYVRGNGDLFVAMMLWLAEAENRIALAPRPDASDPVVLTRNQTRWIRVAGIGVAPGLCLVMSLLVLWRRRRWL